VPASAGRLHGDLSRKAPVYRNRGPVEDPAPERGRGLETVTYWAFFARRFSQIPPKPALAGPNPPSAATPAPRSV